MVFYDTNLPDVTIKTHIIGLCGSDDPSPIRTEKPGEKADGWMFSDFYMVNHMLRGLGKSQAWFTSRDPQGLVKEHGKYLHGNEFVGRRVVLDEDQQPDRLNLRIYPTDYLREAFIHYLTVTCKEACEAGEPVLLCVFAHGNEDTHGAYIGKFESGAQPELSISDLLPILDKNKDLHLTLLMTSCFSGGWAISPDLAAESGRRLTAMTAAGPEEVSESWPESHSVGRQAGSLYVSAILNTLQETTDKPDTESGKKAYSTEEFAGEISYQLQHVVDPRFGDSHQAQFAVQGDQWEENYHQRTGVPLHHYRSRLRELKQLPATTPSDPRLNRSATDEEIAAWEAAGNRSNRNTLAIAMGSFGGNMSALQRQIRLQAKRYMDSHPGRSSIPPNMSAHAAFDRCIKDPDSMSDAHWENVWNILFYRTTMMKNARIIVLRAGMNYCEPALWNEDLWVRDFCNNEKVFPRYREILGMIKKTSIFPHPLDGKTQGSNKWRKPIQYLAAALAESPFSMETIEKILQKADQDVAKTISSCVEAVKSTNEIAYRDGTWWASIKRRARGLSDLTRRLSLSPSKKERGERKDSPIRSPPSSSPHKRRSGRFD